MRSMLFVPGDSDKKLAKGLELGADALIIDLEDSVVVNRKPEARKVTRAFLAANRNGPKLFVRINPLSTPYALDDLAAVTGGAPDGIVLPKCASGADLVSVNHYLSVLEAREGLQPAKISDPADCYRNGRRDVHLGQLCRGPRALVRHDVGLRGPGGRRRSKRELGAEQTIFAAV